MHVLFVAADLERTSVAKALNGRCGCGNVEGQANVAGSEGILLRRRHVQHSESAHRRIVRQAETLGTYMVLHLASHYRFRNPQGHEGSWMPAAHRGLRKRRPADS